jgi:hypothetical protein
MVTLLKSTSATQLPPNDLDYYTSYKGADPISGDDDNAAPAREELPRHVSGWKSWHKAGWRVGVSLAATSAVFALLVNLITAIWVANSRGFHDGMATLYTGNCKKTETMNTWIHLAINALSTLLLSGSNYCMQCLSAPTREEVDRAHAKRMWLDVGIPSVRNLRNIAWKRVVLWWCLGLSSVPLHLMYNSVFFSAIATNNYNYIYASEGFARGAWFNETRWPSDNGFDGVELQKNAPTFENLTDKGCIQAYANDFVSTRRNVLLVVEGVPANGTKGKGSILEVNAYEFVSGKDKQYNPYSWICEKSDWLGDECYKKIPSVIANLTTDGWPVGPYKIKYCLSERVEESCSLHFSMALIVVVIVCNFGKVFAMTTILFILGRSKPLITMGDAIDSFMTENDPCTKGMCLASWKTFRSLHGRPTTGPQKFASEPHTSFRAASKERWVTFYTL